MLCSASAQDRADPRRIKGYFNANAGMSRLSLQTGSWDFFKPAVALYKRHGFVECPPFAGYVEDPNSIFLSLDLDAARWRP